MVSGFLVGGRGFLRMVQGEEFFLDDSSFVAVSAHTFLLPLMMLCLEAWLCRKPAPSLPYCETLHLGAVSRGMTATLHGQSILAHIGAL